MGSFHHHSSKPTNLVVARCKTDKEPKDNTMSTSSSPLRAAAVAASTNSNKEDIAKSSTTEQKQEEEEKAAGGRRELKRLQQDDPTLTSLRIMSSGYGRHNSLQRCELRNKKKPSSFGYFRIKKKEDWAHLGNAIATNTNLHSLELLDLDMEWNFREDLYNEFFSKLNENRSICRLTFKRADFYSGLVFSECLSNFLVENTNLTSLSINYCNQFDEDTDEGEACMNRLCSTLEERASSLKYIDLSSCRIKDFACFNFITTLGHCNLGLRSLELNNKKGSA